MRHRTASAGLCMLRALCALGVLAAAPVPAQQTGKLASQKEQAELAQPPGTPSVQPRGPQQGPQAQRPAAKDSELRYGPSLYDPVPQTPRDAARADETDKIPRHPPGEAAPPGQKPPGDTPEAQPETGKPGVKKQDGKTPAARARRSTTQAIATMPPPPPLRAPGPIAPLPSTPPAVRAGPMPATCGPAGCLTPSGQHLNPGIGTALIDPEGRTCVRTGNTVQCN